MHTGPYPKLVSGLLLLLSAALVLCVRLVPLELVDADLTYTGEDGRAHVYLGDYDSYLWLRYARNLLRTGHACDAVVDGECRDTHTDAPFGARTPYARTLHVSAIAGLHRFITAWIAPNQPLPATAAMVPIIVGVVGAVPAFCVGRLLGGPVAGPFAVVLTMLEPLVLGRTIGGDNDVWNVVLPLCTLWFVLLSLQATRAAPRAAWAAAAGGCVGLQAWAWRGWPFLHVVVTTALVCITMIDAAHHAAKRRTLRVWESTTVRQMALVVAVYCIVAGIATSVTPDGGYFKIPGAVFDAIVPKGETPPAASELDWPSGLRMVAETASLNLAAIARLAGGPIVLVLGWLGIVLLLTRHRAVLASALLCGSWLVIGGIRGSASSVVLLGVPLVFAAVVSWRDDNVAGRLSRAAAVTLVLWFSGAAYTARGGVRFYLLLVPPLGIACAVLIGRVWTATRAEIRSAPGWYRATATAGLTALLALAFLRALTPGLALARGYRPLMNDAWWDTLTHVRETTSPDAIVHTWWDYGHWVTYVADRRVTNDGSSLQTHIPYWTSRALLATSEAESAGILRMLSCGSDALPLPEGAAGAYATVRRTGRDPAAAFGIVNGLVVRDAVAAGEFLTARGFTPAEQRDVLRTTHCVPTDSYLVLTTRLVDKRTALVTFGAWDPARPMVARTEHVPNDPDAPGTPFLARWIPCEDPRPNGERVCPIRTSIAAGHVRLETFTYREDAPDRSVLVASRSTEEPASAGAPAVVLMAGARALERVVPASPVHPDLGVLIDVPNGRVLVGAPSFLASTLVQLLYLDGRYTSRYAKIDERVAASERVTTWKISWSERAF